VVILVLTEIKITLPDFSFIVPGDWREHCSKVLYGTLLLTGFAEELGNTTGVNLIML
jgi:hypothetical protein